MNWTIKGRLQLLIGVAALTTALLLWIGQHSVDVGIQGLTDVKRLSELESNAAKVDMLHDAIRGDTFLALIDTDEALPEAKKDIEEDTKEFESLFNTIAHSVPDELKPSAQEIVPAIEKYSASAMALYEARVKSQNAALNQFQEFQAQFKVLEEKLGDFDDKLKKHTQYDSDTDIVALRNNGTTSLAGGAVALVFLCIVGFLIVRSLNKTVDDLSNRLAEVSESVRQQVEQINNSSRSLAESSSKQAASLEETAASIEEVSSMVRQTADNSLQAKSLSTDVETASIEGVSAMMQMASAIDSIKVAAEETATIVKTIDDIAFQTNLLALNAAVEAARAGDAGKGFAVVADEVRALAQRSSTAAKDTSEKIKRSRELADNGVRVSGEVKRSLEQIKEKVAKTTQLINEIAAANQEQSTGLREVNKAAGQLDQSTQQNAAQSEELAASSDYLYNHSMSLLDVVKNLTLLVRGTSAVPLEARRKEVKKAEPKKPYTEIVTADRRARSSHAIELKAEQAIPLDDGDYQGF